MEYRINNFNLADIEIFDSNHLSLYLSLAYENHCVKNLMLGPNLITLTDFSYLSKNILGVEKEIDFREASEVNLKSRAENTKRPSK